MKTLTGNLLLLPALVASIGLIPAGPVTAQVTLTVTNGSDSGVGTLRQAILDASPSGDTINFAAGITTIDLTSGELLIDKNLAINGPGANLLTVRRSSGLRFRIFRIFPASITASISGLKIADGSTSLRTNGGGISNAGALTLRDCTISGNFAGNVIGFDLNGGYFGGIDNLGFLTITNTTISGNSALYYCGGLGNSGRVTITNSTISGNSAGAGGGGGGGGICNNGTLTITNSTVAGNSALGGGGIANGGVATARNTIIALNTAPSGPDVSGALTSEGFNLIGNNADATISPAQPSDQIGTAGSPIDPLVGPLQGNGGPTFTRALLPGSPAIDAGDDSVLSPPLNLATDQRGAGFPRKVGAKVDIGAFEVGQRIFANGFE